MKKYTMIILILAAVFGAMSAPNVYAAGVAAGTFAATTIQMGDTTTMVYNLSKNVYMEYGKYQSGTTAAAYAICTYHSSGDKVIGTGSVDQKVYYQDVAAFSATYTTSACNAPSDTTTSLFAGTAGWSAL